MKVYWEAQQVKTLTHHTSRRSCLDSSKLFFLSGGVQTRTVPLRGDDTVRPDLLLFFGIKDCQSHRLGPSSWARRWDQLLSH